MIVCVCKNVSDRDIRSAMANGANTIRGLRNELAVSTCCGKCAPQVKAMVDGQHLGAVEQAVASAQSTLMQASVQLRSALYQPTLTV